MINFNSNITRKVLGYYFINPESRLYVRELANLLKLDPGNLSKKMAELKNEGIFLVETEGKNLYFKLNKKFPLLNEYKNIYEAKFGVIESIKKALGAVNKIKEAYIFGSYAKGNFEADSDIDLLIIGDNEHSDLFKAISGLEKIWHREISIIDFSQEEFALKLKNKDPFLQNIFSGKTIKVI